MQTTERQHLTFQATQENEPSSLSIPGLYIRREAGNLLKNFSFTRLKTNEPAVAAEKAVEISLKNIVGHHLEYAAQVAILPIDIEIKTVGSQKRIVPRGEETLWIDSVDVREREGAVKRTCEKVEKFLLNAPPGSVAFDISPPGWSDLETESGQKIVFENTQIHTYAISSTGKLEAYTTVTDISLEETENMLFNASATFLPREKDSEKERIKAVVEHPVFLKAEGGFAFAPESVFLLSENTLLEKRNREEKREKMQETLENRHSLLELSPLQQKTLDTFSKNASEILISNKPDKIKVDLLEKEIVNTALMLSFIKRKEKERKEMEENHGVYKIRWSDSPKAILFGYNPNHEAQLLYEQARAQGGCAGGGCEIKNTDGTTSTTTSLGNRLVTVEDKKEENEKLCPHGKLMRGSEVNCEACKGKS